MTLGEIIKIASLVVAITIGMNGIILAILFGIFKSEVKSIKESMIDTKKNINYINSILNSLIEVISEISTMQNIIQGVVERLVDGNIKEKLIKQNINEEFNQNNLKVQKTMQELMAYSKEQFAQESAFRVLIQYLGNSHSLIKLKNVVESGVSKNNKLLISYVKYLEDRLDQEKSTK